MQMGTCLAKLWTSVFLRDGTPGWYTMRPTWFGKGRQDCVCLCVFSFKGFCD